ncbi:MAG: Nicotinamide-nucleotide adenylyltransferase [Promethearchaeota archaeon CR_4]|nr:MAG: Nicotinamide-nucleotide adenylyltransferase [Candidatus Lokiarchaeota archaeon CR_4]
MRRALYIGRFQIFHNGHLDVLHTIAGTHDIEGIVIAVGSTQYDHEHKSPIAPWAVNPFTIAERIEMIERSLNGVLYKPWKIWQVPDFHDWDNWYDYIIKNLPEFFCLYSSSARERDFFNLKGKEVRGFPHRFNYNAGSLRLALSAGEDISDKVPPPVMAVLQRIDAAKRIRMLLARDDASINLSEEQL